MATIGTFIFYIFIFLSVYAQVFLFVTFFENRKRIFIRTGATKLENYPAVTIIVPCWNEERTVGKTVKSLLELNYPQDKLNIILVDDGSTDKTFSVLEKFKNYSNVTIFKKENGGKHTALNLGLQNTTTEYLACLDADSVAEKQSLARIMSYFKDDASIMAVAPSVTVQGATVGIIGRAQKAEYHMGVYMKKMLGFLGAINVTPGPLTVFKKQVFTDLGPYRYAHNTEDMEIAYRMQKNGYKIEHCPDAYVYTTAPVRISKLFKQRLRWIYGFINNTLDYKNVVFKKEYGYFSTFTLPMGIISILSVVYLFGRIVYNFSHFIYTKVLTIQTVGLHLPHLRNFDPFFINIQSSIFIIITIYALMIFAILFGRRMSEGKWSMSYDMFYFFPVFTVIAPFWIMKAVYNTVLLRKAPAWR